MRSESYGATEKSDMVRFQLMDANSMTDDELLQREPIARIQVWDAKSNDHTRAGDEWCALQAECKRRGLPSSTTWTDFWPTSPRAKALRVSAGLREPEQK